MICVIALVVFGILGIFSATHRTMAKEAFDCVFRRITLRKCTTGLDKRLKSHITGLFMRKSPKAASFVYKNFEIISWAFLIVFIASFIYAAIGGYNYYLYGNCNGPNEDGFCVFDPLHEKSKFTQVQFQQSCALEPPEPKELTLLNVDLSVFPSYYKNAENEVIFIGCYGCPYTRKAYPTIRKLLERSDVNFIFAHFPMKEQTKNLSNILNSIYQLDKQKFIKFNDMLFSLELELLKDERAITKIIEDIGMDPNIVKEYAESSEIISLTNKQLTELQKTGVYGTPTVFVNGKAVVGPKPYRVYKRLLK